jgi:23S rRNA pseudouridine2605 synthase
MPKKKSKRDDQPTEKKFISRGSNKDATGQERKTPYSKSVRVKSSYNRYEKKPYVKRGEEGPENKRSFFKKQRFNRDGLVAKPRTKKEEVAGQPGKIRLNKFISNSGVCSRREADNLIAMGLISVNGKVITEMGYKVNPGDEVRYENKILRAEKPVYILMNKPKGFLTTTRDPQERNTVMHIIGSAIKERVYPVGRLDRNTTGLLLLTNDGDLAEKLSHPSYNVKKIYKVELDKPLTKNDFQKILDGVSLEEGRAVVDDLAVVSPDGKTIGLELHIGWNRVVRRIFEALGYQVVKLDRTVYAGLDKKDLPRGEWRILTREEIIRLKNFM